MAASTSNSLMISRPSSKLSPGSCVVRAEEGHYHQHSGMSDKARKAMEENKLSSISQADSDEKIGEFWDSHDFTDFDTETPDAEFEVLTPPSVNSNCSTKYENKRHRPQSGDRWTPKRKYE
jgi:hypothetical protein